jgi:hypothetical protein
MWRTKGIHLMRHTSAQQNFTLDSCLVRTGSSSSCLAPGADPTLQPAHWYKQNRHSVMEYDPHLLNIREYLSVALCPDVSGGSWPGHQHYCCEALSQLCEITEHTVCLKNTVIWVVTLCGSCKNRRFGGTYSIHHQGDKKWRARTEDSSNSNRSILLTLMLKEIHSCETWALTRATRRHIPEDDFLHSRRKIQMLTELVCLHSTRIPDEIIFSRERIHFLNCALIAENKSEDRGFHSLWVNRFLLQFS